MIRDKIQLGLFLCVLTVGLGLGVAAGCSSPTEQEEPTATVQQALLPCDPASPFNPPVAAFTGTTIADAITFSQDGLKAYLSGKVGSATSYNIYVTTRTAQTQFQTLTEVPLLNTTLSERAPSLSADGTRLYFGKHISSGTRSNLMVSTITNGTVGTPSQITNLNANSLHEQDPFFLPATNQLFYAKEPVDGHRDLYVSNFTAPATYGNGVALVSNSYDEYRPVLSPDGLTLYFSSTRSGLGDDTGGDLWLVKRAATTDAFNFSSGQIKNLYTLNTSRIEFPAGISNDGCTLYFASNRDTTSVQDFRLYQATRGTNVPSTVTTTIKIVGTGSIVTPPYQCSTTCEFDAPPDSVIYVEASDQAIWSGSCSPYGGGESGDGAFVFSNGGTCTVTFSDGMTGAADSGCLSSTWCQPGLECTLNVCRCPPNDPNCVCTPTCPNNACLAPNGCGGFCPCEPGEPCFDDTDCGGGAKCCGETCGGEGCDCTAATQCAPGLECTSGLCSSGPPEHCSNGVPGAGETDTDCGGECAGCGAGAVCALATDCATGLDCVNGLCAVVTLCSSDLDCPPLLSCAQNVGAQFGLTPEADVCWPLHCNEMDPSQPGCGVNDDPLCGTCPACTPDCTGRSCGSDGCGGSCGTCAGGQACTPGGSCIDGMAVGGFYATSGHTTGFPMPLPEQSTAEVGAVPGNFSVSDRGAATYSIPIRLPPARGGFEPALALAYTGGKHEGIMGPGWRVSGLSAVARCPRDGRPTSYTLPEFCLDGAHLIELDNPNNSDDREYRTEIDTFSKIVGHGITVVPGPNNTTNVLGPAYFEVMTKDGRRLTYGKSGNSSLVSHNTKRVWALEEAHDQAGNAIRVEYYRHTVRHGIINGVEIDAVRSDTAELRPRTITYNGHQPERAGDLWVEFGYESRPDPQFHFVDGARGFSLQRLKSITAVVAGTPVRTYTIEYASGSQTTVESIAECADEGGEGDACVPATMFAYEPFVPYEPVSAGWLDLGAAGSDATLAILDQDGDGYSDVIVRQQTGSGTTFKIVRSRVQPDGTISGDAIALPWQSAFVPNLTADVNRDGKDDIIDPGGSVSISGSNGFTQSTFARPSGTIASALTLDFDGDGQRDYVTVQSGLGVAFFHTLGDRLGDGVLFSPPDVPNDCFRLLPIDVDGDRSEEALCIPLAGGDLVAVGASRSIEGLLPKTVTTGITVGQTGSSDVAALDFNGDGLRDILERRSSGAQYVLWENSGDGFLPRVLETAISGGGEPSYLIA